MAIFFENDDPTQGGATVDPARTAASQRALERYKESLDATAARTQALMDNYNKLSDAQKANSDIVQRVYDQKIELLRKIEQQIEKQEEVTESHVQAAKKLGITIEAGENYLAVLSQLKDATDELTDAQAAANEKYEDAIDKFLALGGFGKRQIEIQKKLSQSIKITGMRIKQMGMGAFLASKAKQILAGIVGKLQEAFIVLFLSMFKVAFALDKMTSEFKKQTGIMDGEYTDAIVDTYTELRQYGVTVENAGKSQAALVQGFTNYTMLSKSERATILRTTAVLEAQGIAAETTAASFQVATKILGETGDQADETVRQISAVARELGIAPAQLQKDFAAASGQIAKLGAAGEKAFFDMAEIAKETGLEVQRLYDIVSQFDTFEGAAQAAGRLNAMLGGPFLGTMEMIAETDPAKRFDMLRGALDDAGKSFDSMGYYEKQAIANAMGLKDVSELALVMSDRTDLLAGASEKSAEEIEKEAERAAQMQDVMTQLKDIFLSLAPVIFAILEPLKGLAELLRENPKLAKAVGYALMAFLGYKLFAGPIKGLGSLAKMFKKGKDAAEDFGGGVKNMSKGFGGMKLLVYIAAFTGLLMALSLLTDPATGGGSGNILNLAVAIGALLGVLLAAAGFLMIPGLDLAFIVVAAGITAIAAALGLLAAGISLLPEGVLNKIFGVAPEAPPPPDPGFAEFNATSLIELQNLNYDEIAEGLDSLVDPMNKIADATQRLNTAGLEALADIPRSMQLIDDDKTNKMIAILQAGAELNQPAPDTLLATLNELIAAVTDSGAGIQGAIAGQKDKKMPDLIVKVEPRETSNFIKDVVWEELGG